MRENSLSCIPAQYAQGTTTSLLAFGLNRTVLSGIRLNYLLELKDSSKPPSKRRLTDDEQAWHEQWKGQVNVVCSPKEALEIVGIFNNVPF
jgi:hypothetical protein